MQNAIPKNGPTKFAANIRYKWNYGRRDVKSLLKVDVIQLKACFIGVLHSWKRYFNRVKNAEYRF